MLGRLSGSALCVRGIRTFSSSVAVLSGGQRKFQTPQEFVQLKATEAAQDQQFKEHLLHEAANTEYKPKTIRGNDVNPVSKRPVPLNVELLQYEPIQLPKTHGHKVAVLKFRGYDKSELSRAGEFALRSAFFLGIPTLKLANAKTEKRLYTVIKSPFAQAKLKQNFHRVTYNRYVVAYDANPEIVDLWLSYINKHAIEGINYSAELYTQEGLDYATQLENLALTDMALPEAYADLDDPIASKVEELLQSQTFSKLLEKE